MGPIFVLFAICSPSAFRSCEHGRLWTSYSRRSECCAFEQFSVDALLPSEGADARYLLPDLTLSNAYCVVFEDNTVLGGFRACFLVDDTSNATANTQQSGGFILRSTSACIQCSNMFSESMCPSTGIFPLREQPTEMEPLLWHFSFFVLRRFSYFVLPFVTAQMNTDTPPRTPPRHPRRLTRNPGNGIVLERLRPASGASSGSLSPMT